MNPSSQSTEPKPFKKRVVRPPSIRPETVESAVRKALDILNEIPNAGAMSSHIDDGDHIIRIHVSRHAKNQR